MFKGLTRISHLLRNIIGVALALVALAFIYTAKAVAAVDIQVTHDLSEGFK